VHYGGSPVPSYVGADRRQARAASRQTITRGELAAFVAALALVGIVLPAILSSLPTLDTARHAQAALRTTWSMLFVCAGLMRVVRWRLTGETATALLGSGMVCFGLLSAATAPLTAVIHNTQTDVQLNPATRAVAVTVFLIALARTFKTQPVNARVRPIRNIARLLLGASAVLAVALLAAANGYQLSLPGQIWLAVGLVQAAAWLTFAIIALVRSARDDSASYIWVGLGMLLMTSAELLHAFAFVGPMSLAFFGTCIQVVAGGVALVNSTMDLGLVFSADGNRMLFLSGALHEAEESITEEERAQEERLHDARSVICALKAASITLDRYDERLDTKVKHSLRSSLVSELARLERVIDGRRREPLQEFRLDVALGAVLTAERENGLVITNKLGSVKALGRPLELATVVQNLLVNARRYAPGSMVRVSATSSGGRVQILVEDRGPGVDPTHHELVFQRGYQCNAGAGEGSGLGLFLARRLMREQDGEVVLRERPGGGACFVLSLRSPSLGQQPQNGVQVGDSVDTTKDRLPDEGNRAAFADLPRQRDNDARGRNKAAVVRDDEIHHPARRRAKRDLQAT
jgi:signal transduction histidine kinase